MRLHAPIAALVAALAGGPAAAALNPGDLVATDRTGQRLWRIDPVAGTAEVFSPPEGIPTSFSSPTDVATTPDRGVYVADQHRILEVNPDTGSVLPLLELDLVPAPHLVAMSFDGLVAGMDADANGALWVVEDRPGQPGRLWKVTPSTIGWSRTVVQSNADLARIGNGLAVTSDDDGNANDVYFTTPFAGMLNVDVASGAGNELSADIPAGISSSFGGNIDAIGDCSELLCTVLFLRATWPLDANSCTASQVFTFFVVAIIAGVEPLDYVLPCASAVAMIGASDAYLLMVDFREIGAGTPTRVIRFRNVEDEWVSEHVAWLDGYETATESDAYAGMDFVLAPEPESAAGALAALMAGCVVAARGRSARTRSRPR